MLTVCFAFLTFLFFVFDVEFIYHRVFILPLLHIYVHIIRPDENSSENNSKMLDAPSDWRLGGHGFNPCRGRQHSFVEIDREIFSTVILFLPLIQEGQLSVSGERMCTILVNRLED